MKPTWHAVLDGLLLLVFGASFLVMVRAAVLQPLRQAYEVGPTQEASMPPDAHGRQPNRLIREKSPYLLQHAYNPVDWHPWGGEALAKAKQEDKPIFLSIGYSTCYWCHVMERESFESPEIAALINASFIPIKVDREERPDLDALYMQAVMGLSGQGGWPMTVFLTPEGQPFWGGTYVPPEDRHGRPGMTTLLPSIAQAWQTQREKILSSSQAITQALQASATRQAATPLTTDTLERAVEQYAAQFDPTHGGFGPAPKFPRSHSLSFLLRSWFRARDAEVLAMVETTLEAMARGGLRDHVGGGFHRYSTDDHWLVPHFEKMLYDQALLARTYLEAFQVTGKTAYAEVVRELFEYVLRDLRDPRGGFYSAEDAGEVGEEGEFYVWTPVEVEAALGPEDAKLFSRVYDVTPGGNFSAEGGSAPTVDRSGGEGKNILHVEQPIEDVAKRDGRSVEEVRTQLASARQRLLAARNARPRPHRDDKILTDWNGLMIGALAYGARVLGDIRYAQAAQDAAAFLVKHLQHDQQLLHRYRDGEARIPAFLDDYVFLAWGLLELYEATFDARWLQEAQRLTQEMVRLFWDDAGGGFFLTGAHHEPLVAKTKDVYDGALPSGNSVAALVLVRLGQLTMDEALHSRAERLFEAFSSQVTQVPQGFPQLLTAFDAWLGPAQEIVVAGDPRAAATQAMLIEVSRRFLPRATVVLHPAGGDTQTIEQLAPFIKEQLPVNGKPTVYLCEHYLCRLPTTSLEQATAQLDALR